MTHLRGVACCARVRLMIVELDDTNKLDSRPVSLMGLYMGLYTIMLEFVPGTLRLWTRPRRWQALPDRSSGVQPRHICVV
jgi:hypothetical protein